MGEHVPGGEHQFQFSCPLWKKNRWINLALLFVVVVVFVYNSKKLLVHCQIVTLSEKPWFHNMDFS